MKINIIIGLLILVVSCKTGNIKSSETKKLEDLPLIKIENALVSEDKLMISISNGNRTEITFNKEESEFEIAPDSSSFIINSRILSTIQVSKLYTLNSKGNIDTSQVRNLSSEVWDSLSKKNNISIDEINFPKTTAKFLNKTEIQLNVQGQTESGIEIKENLNLKAD